MLQSDNVVVGPCDGRIMLWSCYGRTMSWSDACAADPPSQTGRAVTLPCDPADVAIRRRFGAILRAQRSRGRGGQGRSGLASLRTRAERRSRRKTVLDRGSKTDQKRNPKRSGTPLGHCRATMRTGRGNGGGGGGVRRSKAAARAEEPPLDGGGGGDDDDDGGGGGGDHDWRRRRRRRR